MNTRESRGSRVAAIGAVLGLVPAAGLGLLSFLNSDGPPGAEVVGALSLALVYASPYVVVLVISRVRNAGARGGLLAPIGLLSLVASFSSMSIVTVVFLPATCFIWLAVARSLAATTRPLPTILLAAAGGAVVAAAIVSGFFALLLVQEDEDRCWVLQQDSNGHRRWESVPNVAGPGGLSPGPISGPSVRSICTSDVITTTEAAASAGILALALIAALLMTRRRWPDPSSGPSTSG